MYSAFRDRGILFEDDTYAKIDEGYRRLFEMFKEHSEGPILTKKKNDDKNKSANT